jgi:hypothetical protein
MATNATDVIGARPATATFGSLTARWIYVFTAGLFVATALVGFVPESFGIVAAVKAGQRPPLPTILHVHAVLMGSWLLLLLVQSILMATGRRALHMRLGLLSLVLLPAVLVAGILLVRWSWIAVAGLAASPPPGMSLAAISDLKNTVTVVLAGQIRTLISFPILAGWAILVRRSDPETHKRLMFLATVIPLGAGTDRAVRFLALPSSADLFTTVDLYSLLLLLPLFVNDLIRHRRVPRAYVIWLVLLVPLTIGVHVLVASPWWGNAAPRLMAIQGW